MTNLFMHSGYNIIASSSIPLHRIFQKKQTEKPLNYKRLKCGIFLKTVTIFQQKILKAVLQISSQCDYVQVAKEGFLFCNLLHQLNLCYFFSL